MIYFDIETVPDNRLGGPDPSRVKVPRNYTKDASIDAYRRENADKEFRDRATRASTGQIVCIAAAVDFHPGGRGQVWCECTHDELLLLENFSQWLEEQDGPPDLMPAHSLCAWRGTMFDYAFVAFRALVHHLPRLARRFEAPRYGGSRHIDPSRLTCMTDTTFADACLGLGIPHPSPRGGSQVFDWASRGEIDSIRQHCIDDVLALQAMGERLRSAGLLNEQR